MKAATRFDILFNILSPLVLGVFIYLLKDSGFMPRLVSYHLPDGLWAYALISSILVIWNREIHAGWITIAAITCVIFEGLQWVRVMPGTADIYDLISYALFIIIALKLNLFFKRKFKPNTNENG
jgi:uncharacterized membrane protein